VARSKRRPALALTLAAAVVAVDQASKWLVRAEAHRLPYTWILGLRVDLTYNSGISFSRFAGAGTVVIVLVAAVALVFAPPRYRPALGVILGGAVSNLIDRAHLHGAVVDFIGVARWPTFNVADAAIVLGTLLLGTQVVFGRRE
jgi:signal peptidase II